jgi:hypothetical protein
LLALIYYHLFILIINRWADGMSATWLIKILIPVSTRAKSKVKELILFRCNWASNREIISDLGRQEISIANTGKMHIAEVEKRKKLIKSKVILIDFHLMFIVRRAFKLFSSFFPKWKTNVFIYGVTRHNIFPSAKT